VGDFAISPAHFLPCPLSHCPVFTRLLSEIKKTNQTIMRKVSMIVKESEIREKMDTPTIRMLDLWRSLSKEITGVEIEVGAGDRHNLRQTRDFQGELNFAYPHIIDGNVVLVLWLDSLKSVHSIVITHEVGHWVLKLQGFIGMLYRPNRNCNVEINLNSMAEHPALYTLQKSIGHEPLGVIDSRTESDIIVFKRENERNSQEIWKQNALLIADDLMNSSDEKALQLREIINKKHPKTMELVDIILETRNYYNLLDKDGHTRFLKMIIRKLKLGDGWYRARDVEVLKEKVNQVVA
jgi:hypothetical protein